MKHLMELDDEERRGAIATALAKVMRTDEGRTVLYALCEMAGIFDPVTNEAETHQSNLMKEFFLRYDQDAEKRLYAALLFGERP